MVPTGFSAEPPLGPAIPVMATVQLARLCASAPWAMARAVASETAPWRSSVVGGTPSMSILAALE